jgi:hypothetical protein
LKWVWRCRWCVECVLVSTHFNASCCTSVYQWLVVSIWRVQNCAVLGYYTASNGNCLPTFRYNLSVPSSGFKVVSWTLYVRPVGCPETPVRNHNYSLRNNLEERSSQPFRGGSLTARIWHVAFSNLWLKSEDTQNGYFISGFVWLSSSILLGKYGDCFSGWCWREQCLELRDSNRGVENVVKWGN